MAEVRRHLDVSVRRLVLRVRGAVAEGLADRAEDPEQEGLDHSRRPRELHLGPELLREDGELEQVGHPLVVGLPVPGEPIERLDHLVEAADRVDRDDHPSFALARVPPVVYRPDRDLDLGAGSPDAALSVEQEPDLALEDLERLVDVAVGVLGGDGAAGRHGQLDDHARVAVLVVARQDHPALARDRVLVDLACRRRHPRLPPLEERRELTVR